MLRIAPDSICFTRPERLVPPASWVEHIPFAMFLIEILRPRLLVELGTHSGNSYCAFCQAVKQLSIDAKCFAVDTWQGDEHSGHYGKDVLVNLREHHDSLYKDFSSLLQSCFDEAVAHFTDGSIDLLHIDGLHTYDAVRHDFETWLPKLSDRAVVLMHDTNVHENGFGVWRLWDELKVKHPSFEFLHGHGLGVLAVGPEYPPALDAILKSPAETTSIRNFFHRLGFPLGDGVEAIILKYALAERDCTIQALTNEVSKRDNSIQRLTNRSAEREQTASAASAQLAAINKSKAWKAMLLLRRMRVSVAPPKSRRAKALRRCANVVLAPYRLAKGLRSPNGNGKGKAWTLGPRSAAATGRPQNSVPVGGKSPCLLDIEQVEPLASCPGRIAVHLHVFHAEMAAEFAGHLRNMPFPYDLYVSAPDKNAQAECARAFAKLPLCEKTKIEIVPNRGRDVAPMLCAFGKDLIHYDFIAHLHSKKSGGNGGVTPGWREYLCTSLFGSERRIRQIFMLLSRADPMGIVYPQTYSKMPSWAHTWLSNRHQGAVWCKRLGIDRVPRGYFDYPVGSMFWARGDALHALFAAGISLEDFPAEAGQLDGTLAHCLERLLVLVARQQGFNHAVIEDAVAPNWSAWRLDGYFSRTAEAAAAHFGDPKFRVIAFDVFDTLVSRPLLDPEAIKEIVAQRSADLGELYRQYRCKAEAAARQQAGRDVGLDQIYAEFAKQTGLSQQESDRVRRLEEEVEWNSVSPRPDGALLLQSALKAGKRVILISDMFLPKDFLERLLERHGIVGWHALYVSNDVGVRKDSGELYRHVLAREGLSPAEMLMVGDNEHVDVQIPHGLGMPVYHVLRAVETARSLPRLEPLVEDVERDKDLNDQLTMGLLLRRAYSPIFHQKFDPASLFPPTPLSLGYSILGPLVLGFVHWLVQQARRDGMDRLYFIAREGQSIKLVYDRWRDAFGEGPPSEYLVLSRRAATVPAIDCQRDVVNIARTNCAPDTAMNFLDERFGLRLSKERWNELRQSSGWTPDRQVEVWNGQIKHDVLQLLDAVQGDILAQAAAERPALLAYLREIDLDSQQRAALVDVGYSATVQDRISSLTNKTVHGYYMMTLARAHSAADHWGSVVRGCFVERAKNFQTAPLICKRSFTLEKMLGTNEGQIVRYVLEGNGRVSAIHKPLSQREQQGNQARTDIRKGLLEYTDDAIQVRKSLFPSFSPPLRLPEEVFLAFVANHSQAEKSVLQTLLLDDFYSGLGLV
jgi:FMN phosphatase YigB (HAD superfamily)